MVVGIRELTVEWGHCDPAGIVFNPRYFEWFDHSTACLFGTAGIPKYDLPKRFDIIGIPIVDTRAKFMVPSKWGDVLRIETRVIEFKRTSFDVEHQLFKADDAGGGRQRNPRLGGPSPGTARPPESDADPAGNPRPVQ